MQVQIDRTQLAQLGIDLPDNFATFTSEQRRAWARAQMERVSLEMFRDFAALHGRTPTAAQQAAYLQRMQPAIDESLASR